MTSTCREELLQATRSIIKAKGINRFTPKEAIEFMQRNNTIYAESTIRTHITSRCCSNAKDHHAVTYNDYEALGNGEYKVINL
ncbi:DUF7669 domain-containing protein [Paenibacillus favisporus]|uniref:DUF7669 domain-containing protein n=1 Tax=Paenibacillus favisporus TaxID=221028 RepID=UPI003B838355